MRARAYFPVLWNGVKTETFSPQNDRTTELNVNFLLTATVYGISYPYKSCLCTFWHCHPYTSSFNFIQMFLYTHLLHVWHICVINTYRVYRLYGYYT